ncbi:MAG: hypothetical protein P4L31_08450 [Candidatus Babeliales bacterium]|nr:hypothetical protein [Candidatus Babeliales bacterium]
MVLRDINFYWHVVLICLYFMHGSCLADHKQFARKMEPIVSRAIDLVAAYKKDHTLLMPIIAIAGAPAVGKSYFARELANLLRAQHIEVKVLAQDDFLERCKVSGYLIHPYLNYKKLHKVLKQISKGDGEVFQPIINGVKDNLVSYAGTDLVIFEGVYSLCGSESFDFFKYCSFGIFMEGNEKDVCAWHWERELLKPSNIRRSKSQFRRELKLNMIDYRSHILPCRHNGEFIVYKKEKSKYSLRS